MRSIHRTVNLVHRPSIWTRFSKWLSGNFRSVSKLDRTYEHSEAVKSILVEVTVADCLPGGLDRNVCGTNATEHFGKLADGREIR